MMQKPWGAGSLSVPLCPVFLQSSRRLLPGRCDLFSGRPFRLVCRQQRPALPPYAAILLKAFVKGGTWIFFILLTQILSLLLPE